MSTLAFWFYVLIRKLNWIVKISNCKSSIKAQHINFAYIYVLFNFKEKEITSSSQKLE